MRSRRPKKKIKSQKEGYKICNYCGDEKHILYFGKNSKYCKRCNAERSKYYRNKSSKSNTDYDNLYIYIVINDSWKDYIKLGRTKDIDRRLSTYQTNSPFRDYKMYFYKKVKDVDLIENYFKTNYNGCNEWFKIDKDIAIKIIEDLVIE